MDNKAIVVRVVIFAVGVGLGFLAGKQVYEGYYAAIAQEEIDSVKEAFEKRHQNAVEAQPNPNPNTEALNGMTDEEDEAPVKPVMKSHPLARSSIETNPSEKAKRNYNLVGLTPHEEDDDEDEDEDDTVTDAAGKTQEEMDLTEINRTEPYIIDDREYTEEFDHHDKLSLYYYKQDDVLCDEHEEVIDDIEFTVGYDAISQLDIQTTIWVRNEPLTIDYEIISINRSYAESVHGIGIETNLSPREKYLRQQKRRDSRDE